MKKQILAFYFLLLFSFFSFEAAATVWTGRGNNNLWSNANNWDTKIVPGPNDDVTIPTGFGDIEFNYNFRQVKSLFINSNNRVIILPNKTLEVTNDTGIGINIQPNRTFLENWGTLRIIGTTSTSTAIQNYGYLYNRGIIHIETVNGYGINTEGGVSNNYSTGLIEVKNTNTYTGIRVNQGTFTNEGTLRFSDRGTGIAVGVNSTFKNKETGAIYFEANSIGVIIVTIESNFYNDGLIDMLSRPTDFYSVFINNASVENGSDATWNINLRESGYNYGFYIQNASQMVNRGSIDVSGNIPSNKVGFLVNDNSDLNNEYSGQISINNTYIAISLSNSLENKWHNKGIVDINNCSYYAVVNQATVTNSGIMNFNNGPGISNRTSGAFTNEGGTLHFEQDNFGDIVNFGKFYNNFCSEITANDRVFNGGTFKNYGYINNSLAGAFHVALRAIENYGIILDPYDQFVNVINNQGIRVPLLSEFHNDWYFTNVFDVGDWGGYAVPEYFYDTEPFIWQNEAGIYHETPVNEFYLHWDYDNESFFLVEFVHASGCRQVVPILVDPALQNQNLGEGATNHFATDRGAERSTSHPNALQVSPNPSNGLVQVQIPQLTEGPLDIRVVDVNGRVVWQQQNTAVSALTLDMTGQVATGIYNLQIWQKGALLGQERLILQEK